MLPKEPHPIYEEELWTPVKSVNLEGSLDGTLIRFEGTHSSSNYVIRVGEGQDIKFTDLWFSDLPGCYRIPVSGWTEPEFSLGFEVGKCYLAPYFAYGPSGLEPRDEDTRMEHFSGMWVQRDS